jgi:hypothetical protein
VFLAAGVLVGALAEPLAGATVIVPRTIEQMAQDSACVVRGRVLKSEAAWDEGHQKIYTTTEIEVLEQVHGPSEPLKKVVVRTLGGEVGKIGMKVAGTERFTPNEEVFVFLRRDPVVKEAYQTVGMSQGKYTIDHELPGRAMAVPSTEGLAFARPDEHGVIKVDPTAPHPDRIALDDLKQRVSDAVHGAQTIAPPKALKPAPSPAAPVQH